MFNSPLQYCTKCKQYIELDQTKDECAALHGCRGADCPLLNMFRPPVALDQVKPPIVPEPTTGLKPAK